MPRSAHRLIAHRHDHVTKAAQLGSPFKLAREQEGINAKTAIFVPAVLGSMPFFWFCCVLAVSSLPAVLTAFDSEVLSGALGLAGFFPRVIEKVSLVALVAWLAQTFIQLVALPVLQVAGNATQAQAEHNTAVLLDRLDTDTKGGLQVILEAIEKLQPPGSADT